MSPLLPKNPVGEILKRVDTTLTSADATLLRVDDTLAPSAARSVRPTTR
jgi:hypothetical protein